MDVIVCHEKHGVVLYKRAQTLVQDRLTTGWYYENWDDGNPKHQYLDLAESARISEEDAMKFLLMRDREDFEYEGFEILGVN